MSNRSPNSTKFKIVGIILSLLPIVLTTAGYFYIKHKDSQQLIEKTKIAISRVTPLIRQPRFSIDSSENEKFLIGIADTIQRLNFEGIDLDALDFLSRLKNYYFTLKITFESHLDSAETERTLIIERKQFFDLMEQFDKLIDKLENRYETTFKY